MERARSCIAYVGKDEGDTLADRIHAFIKDSGESGVTRDEVITEFYADRPRVTNPKGAVNVVISALRRRGHKIYHTDGRYQTHGPVIVDVPKVGHLPNSMNQPLGFRELELLGLLREYGRTGRWASARDFAVRMKLSLRGQPVETQRIARMFRNMSAKGIAIQHKSANNGTAQLLYRLTVKPKDESCHSKTSTQPLTIASKATASSWGSKANSND